VQTLSTFSLRKAFSAQTMLAKNENRSSSIASEIGYHVFLRFPLPMSSIRRKPEESGFFLKDESEVREAFKDIVRIFTYE
jgi:hypothetical protein